jgi:hypothetical protein
LEKSIATDFENKIKQLEANNEGAEIKLKEAREKELIFLQKESALKDKEAELEITIQKKLAEERNQLADTIRQQEQSKTAMKEDEMLMKMEELKKQLEVQKRLADEMKRKAEQGSMQLQGEVQELAIEEWLQTQFPLDSIEEIKKGARGGDCIQTVNTFNQQNCGKIYYESKRTKDFQGSWIEKFKADMREKGADIGVLVTEAMPSDMQRMGMRDGVWVCSYEEFKGLCNVLRESIIQVSTALGSQVNKGDKMQLLYDYLTSNSFRMQVEAIVEGFSSMKTALDSEKRAMQRIWKEREKQIEKVINNTIDMHASIRGIAGNAIQAVKALELPGSDIDESENEQTTD